MIIVFMVKFCLICKQEVVPGSNFCSEHQKHETRFQKINNIEKDFQGVSPPAVFIGSKLEYPKVNVGILTPMQAQENLGEVENPANFNNPNEWVSRGYDIRKIVDLRTSLINSRFTSNVFEARNQSRVLSIAQEVALAMKPANVEINLQKKPSIRKNYFEDTSLPMGPSASLLNASLTENVKISSKVERVVSDTDMKAIDAMRELNVRGFDENQLSQILSVGVLGLGKNRRLVSTRSSITAVDSNLGEDLILEIKDYEKIDDYRLFFGNYFGNYYLVLMFPEIWGYELFETYVAEKLADKNTELNYTTDYEGYKKRTTYASQCVGGYYANRYSVLQYLVGEKKQARIVVYRFTTSEYEVPLGVWVVRQGVKKTMETSPVIFSNRFEMINKAREIILKRFNYNLDNFLVKTKLLIEMKKQRKLSDWG